MADDFHPASVKSSWGEHGSNRFAGLGERFSTALLPQGLPDPHWVAWSAPCAQWLGLPAERPEEDSPWLGVLSGNTSMPGMRPLASVYSGHQFGVWAGQLGDGRAHLLGEMETPNGLMEIQLKGAGPTPYSRRGDGRAVLRSSIREFLCSEAMAGLGIPTTRALCITGSALPVRREEIETAAVVTRVAPSFIRFGHFEHFAHTAQDSEALRTLADFAIAHYFPECQLSAQPYVSLLHEVTRKTAELMADWQAVGFCHGVMNTDNMSLLGLTIDYGPFGFLDTYDPRHICNHSDHQGRYAFARQPDVGFWNLHALAQALMPLMSDEPDAAQAVVDDYRGVFPQAFQRRMRAKLGLQTERPEDGELVSGLLQRMAADRADFSITFRRLSNFDSSTGALNAPIRDLFRDRETFDAWAASYATRLQSENSIDAERALRMNRVNPKYLLRNHLAEAAIQQAREGDFSEVDRLLKVLQRPFDEQPEQSAYAGFPPDWAHSIEVSCSS